MDDKQALLELRKENRQWGLEETDAGTASVNFVIEKTDAYTGKLDKRHWCNFRLHIKRGESVCITIDDEEISLLQEAIDRFRSIVAEEKIADGQRQTETG